MGVVLRTPLCAGSRLRPTPLIYSRTGAGTEPRRAEEPVAANVRVTLPDAERERAVR